MKQALNGILCILRCIRYGLLSTILFNINISFSVEVPIRDFSIKPYSQNINDYIPSDGKDYSIPLISFEYQQRQLQQFYNHYYASGPKGLSPWSEAMVNAFLPRVEKEELQLIEEFNNQNQPPEKLHYGENFKEHDENWLNQIKERMNLSELTAMQYCDHRRAITVAHTFARALPESAPDFYHFTLPGQGFPFDNLQESAIWAGTPLYVLNESDDKAWSLVLTPDGYFAWVHSQDIAYTSPAFIQQWQLAAKEGLVAVTATDVSILDQQDHFLLTGYIGAVFPLENRSETTTTIYIPTQNDHHQAMISIGVIQNHASHLMPLLATKKNMVSLIQQLQNRPYGWGGAFFFNDCSQEMKSLFTPFGIWLPRNSAQQAQLSSVVDLSKKSMDDRISNLKTRGHPLMTIIYIGGHVMLYVGNQFSSDREALTYQNVWGMSPPNGDMRYLIGQSLFFPLLSAYPFNPEINSQANRSYFKLIFLDDLDQMDSPRTFVKRFVKPE